MNFEVAWVLVSSGTQIQPQIILDPDYLPDYLSISYDHEINKKKTFFYLKSRLNQVSVTALPDWQLLHQVSENTILYPFI